jgi:hypothetical protein
MGIKAFFKNAFADMKESTKAQHEVDKANWNAAKAESKAQWEEAKAMITPLGSTAINVVLCAAGGALFAFGLGAISKVVLKKTSLV